MNGNKKTENYNTLCDLDPPHTLAPRFPDVCEKNIFRFVHSSASGKTTLFMKTCLLCGWFNLLMIKSATCFIIYRTQKKLMLLFCHQMAGPGLLMHVPGMSLGSGN